MEKVYVVYVKYSFDVMKLFSNNTDLTKTGLLIAKLRNKCYDKSKK